MGKQRGLTFLLIFVSHLAYSQNELINPNVSYEKNLSGLITKVNFNVKGVKKAIDLYNLNPYGKLAFIKSKESTPDQSVYKVENIQLSKVLPNFNKDILIKNKTGEIKIDQIISTSNLKYSENKKFHIAIFQVHAIAKNNVVGINSTIDVIDSTGLVINEFKNIDVNINEIGITNDGNYIFLTYGSDNEDGDFMKYGFRIYSQKSKKIIIDKEIKCIGFTTNNLIVFGYDYNSDNQILTHIEVYDLYKRKKYTRTFSYDEQKIIEINEEGYLIIFNGQKKLLSFKNDFINEGI